MIDFISTLIECIYRTILLVVARSGWIVDRNLGHTFLEVIVGIVEAKAVGEGQILDRIDISLNLTVDLLLAELAVIVLQCPIGIGNTILGVVGERGIEWAAEVSEVSYTDVTWHLIKTIDYGGTLVGKDSLGEGVCKVDVARELQPICTAMTTIHRNGVTSIRVSIGGHDAIISYA